MLSKKKNIIAEMRSPSHLEREKKTMKKDIQPKHKTNQNVWIMTCERCVYNAAKKEHTATHQNYMEQ